MSARPRTARWVALEQAEEHRLRDTLDALATGAILPSGALELLVAYGQHCAERAAELSRHAAEVRARRRIAAAAKAS